MLTISHYVAADKSTRTVRSLPELAADDVLWIDAENPSDDEQKLLESVIALHPLTVEDLTRPKRLPNEAAHLPKVEEFADYLFVIVNPLPWHVCDPQACTERKHWKWRPQLNAILTGQVLITHSYEHLTCVENVRQSVNKRGDLMGRGPDYLFHVILDVMVDEYAPVVERFADSLDKLEIKLMNHPTKSLLHKLLRMKRRILFLRKTLVLEREVLARLVRAEFDLITEAEIHYYRNVFDHLVRYTELIEGAREMASDLMQMQLAATSNRLSEVMKVLTMISTVILPMTLIAGIYGMNFDNLPELHWEYGYFMALGMMVLVGIGAAGFFRWKRWL